MSLPENLKHHFDLSRIKAPKLSRWQKFKLKLWDRFHKWINPCAGIICNPIYTNRTFMESTMLEADVTCAKCGKEGIYNCGNTQTIE